MKQATQSDFLALGKRLGALVLLTSALILPNLTLLADSVCISKCRVTNGKCHTLCQRFDPHGTTNCDIQCEYAFERCSKTGSSSGLVPA
jgi:hypothetical protein